jgi:LacI family transcriptional regulator
LALTVTISDIARRAGVTKGTVSFVLNDRQSKTVRIAKATKQKILAAARELNYRPSFSARALATGKTRTIGFMCGNIRNPHFTEMADLAMEEVERRGYHLMMGINKWIDEKEDLKCFDALMDRGIDGMIFFGICLQPGTQQYERIMANKFPLITITERIEGLPSITTEWQPGFDQALFHLKEMGHRKAAYIFLEHTGKDRAIAQAAKRADIEMEYHCFEGQEEKLVRDLQEFAQIFSRRSDRPSAAILSSDFLAMRFMGPIVQYGVRVPEDLSLIGVDGTDLGAFLNPPLTSIGLNARTIIGQAVERVVGMAEGRWPEDFNLQIPNQLIVRSSVRKISP